ncbi:MAG: oligosaccharide flippase family protein [Gemmatimonadetes bacterium]|nr:oligosaccharide flippase family protein [Gemmatimonadota bacterium]
MITPQKMFKGFFYTLGTGYAARLCSVGLTVLIKRQLEPSVFADVFLGVTVFTMLSSLREFGLTHALLHFQDRVEEFVGTHFALNVCITLLSCLLTSGVVLALTLLFPADFSWTFAQVAWVLAALHFVRQLTLTSEALLRMDFEFGRLSLLHGLGTLLALSSALLAAHAGWEEWSLILGGWTTYSVLSVVYVLFFSTATWCSRPLRLTSLRFDWVWARRLLGYGVWIWIGWVLQIFIWWYDKLVVRLVVGDTALALYETAWWLVQIPTAVIAHIILNYSGALYSRYRHERERLGELFSKMISLVLRVSAPVSLILVFNAREITALLGGQWAGSARIVVWLAAYALLRPLLSDGLACCGR